MTYAEEISHYIQRFQQACSLDEMRDISWSCAAAVAEAPNEIIEELKHAPRHIWLDPILSMARKQGSSRYSDAVANVREILFLTDIFARTTIPSDARDIAERSVFSSLISLDMAISVNTYFGNPIVFEHQITVEQVSWLPAIKGQEMLASFEPSLTALQNQCYWWKMIAENGRHY